MDELISLLSDNDYISGEKLCLSLGMTRGAVWKRVEKLRREGYDLRSAGKRGYALFLSPDSLLPAYVQKSLKTRRAGLGDIYYQRSISSTNAWCKEKAAQGAKDGTLCISEEQTSGRGRLGRAWDSGKGESLLMSLLLRPNIPPENAHTLTLAAALATAKAVEETTGLRPLIKWPNDVLLSGKKLSGILVETAADMDLVRSAVIGIGINVRQRAFSGELRNTATSLFIECGRLIDRRELLCALLLNIEREVELIELGGFSAISEDYIRRSATIGKTVTVKPVSGESEYEAQAVSLDETGALIINVNGEKRRVVSAEVSIRGGI